MPVTTRSKRKNLDPIEMAEKPKRLMVKLVDITNKKRSFNETAEIKAVQSFNNTLVASQRNNDNNGEESSQRIECFPSDLQNTQSYESQPTTSFEDALNMMKIVKKVLANKLRNSVDRLQLDIVPECLYDIKMCEQLHIANVCPLKSVDSLFLAKLFLAEERHFQFFQYMRRTVIAANLFPGSSMCLSIIQEILKYKSKDKKLSTSFVLSELHNIFATILNKFPSCQMQQGSYLKIFTTQIQIEGLPEKKQVLPTVLDILHDIIFVTDDGNLDKSYRLDFNKNFFLWDIEQDASSFTSLSRNDQCDRVFMVLELLVRLLEFDMAVHTTKHGHQFKSALVNKEICPLICSAIWKEYEDLMTVNATIKKIISIFVAMAALNYPADRIKTVSRLLNLIINVINMYEYPDKTIQYPLYKTCTLNILNAIQKTVENSVYYSMDLWINVIKNIRSPLARMLLSKQLHEKIANQELSMSLSVPIKAVYNQDFLHYDKNSTAVDATKSSGKYPRHDNKKKQVKKFKISQSDFIGLMMLYADAVIQYFHLHDIVDSIKHVKESDATFEEKRLPEKFDFSNFGNKIENVDLDEKVCLRTTGLSMRNVIHIKLSKENCTFYRNEIKNYSRLIKIIKRYHQKFGSEFDEWIELLKKY